MNKHEEMMMFIQEAKREANAFHSTNNIIYLRQAGNKLYNAYILLMELILNQEIQSSREVSEASYKLEKKDRDFYVLYGYVLALHKWFYEGIEDARYAASVVLKSSRLMEKIQRRYKV